MPTINILDKKIYNRIAAGEVVERPFSVIKELIENALDAGATQIDVTIENGGKTLMRVADNGCGISSGDMVKAFLPHATSKIKNVEDLDRILTLGFRGEALASIGSVSNATIVSKTIDDKTGSVIECNGGVIGDVEAYPADIGTVVTVEDLFFNTPARAKFLKPDKSEESDITNILTRMILSHPEVAFKYTADGKVILQSFGGGLDEAIIEIYGFEAINNCVKIETVKNGMKVSGYLGSANYTKPNRTYQTVILNGRYVVNNTIQSAIHNAYASYLMKRKYPFYVLKIDMSPEAVDVNVHPNKTDVRFIDNQVVYGTLTSIVSKVLDGSAAALEIIVPDENAKRAAEAQMNFIERENRADFLSDGESSDKNPEKTTSEPSMNPEDFRKEADELHCDRPFVSAFKGTEKLFNSKEIPPKIGTYIDFSGKQPNRTLIFSDEGEEIGLPEPDPKSGKSIDEIFAENKKYIAEMEAKKAEEEKRKAEQQALGIDTSFRVVGQVLTTYLILEREDDIFFIDQHAAHERLLYNRFIEAYKENSIAQQPMLIPYVLRVNGSESEFLHGRLDDLRKSGFDISENDVNSFSVYAVPLLLQDIDLKEFFDDFLSDINFKKDTVPEIIHEKIAMKACKAAIKSGKTLSEDEIDALLKDMKYDTTLRCPHGRPVTAKISRTEIDKWFKRIV